MIQKLTLVQVFCQPIVPISFVISFATLISVFFYCIKSGLTKTDKQISWILTFTSSLVCTVISIPHFFFFWRSGWDMNLLSFDSNFHISMVCFFISYLVLDLSLGSIYYRHRITVLTGWIHHPLYTGILLWLLKSRSSSFFSASCLLELPTLLLAIGSIRNQWRCDFLFASTFFVLRLVFHSYMIIALKQYHRLEFLWMVAMSVFPLHLYWFYGNHLIVLFFFKKKNTHMTHTSLGIIGQLIKRYPVVYKSKTDGVSSAVVQAKRSKHSFLERIYTI